MHSTRATESLSQMLDAFSIFGITTSSGIDAGEEQRAMADKVRTLSELRKPAKAENLVTKASDAARKEA
jgi:hypothetical protein